MIKLSERLQAIADEIGEGEAMADIGTDHGFLPLFLWEQGRSPRVVFTDSSPEALDRARQTCRRMYPQTVFDLRLGSGLSVLEKNEVENVVLAGMGGLLMMQILAEDPEKTRSFQRFILQPRRHVGHLRHYLLHHGFSITREQLVREGKYICEIITAGPVPVEAPDPDLMAAPPDAIVWEVPAWYGAVNDPLTGEYIKRRLAKEEKRLLGMRKGKAGKEEERALAIAQANENIRYLRRLLEGK